MITDVTPVPIYNSAEIFRPKASYFFTEQNYAPKIVFHYDTAVLEAIQSLRVEISEVKAMLSYLMANSPNQSMHFVEPYLTDQRSDDELLLAVKEVFVKAGDETIYPSDVARHLNLPYERVVTLLEKLERNGQIAGV